MTIKRIDELREKISSLKEEALQEVINDNSLSKVQKLRLIDDYDLLDYHEWINHPFAEWNDEVFELERIEAQKLLNEGKITYFHQSSMVDDDINHHCENKGERISYADYLDSIEEYEDKIPVLTTRNPHITLYKTYEEVVDYLYDYCLMNKIIGHVFDW